MGGKFTTQRTSLNLANKVALSSFAAGIAGLGIVSIIFHDFALTWQPVPLWIPGRTALAIMSGLFMLITSLGLLLDRSSSYSSRALLLYFLIWSLLKVPEVVAAPQLEVVWLGIGEIAVLLAGGWASLQLWRD